ncbi:MAG: M20/M25/M40 family metallo-hydrolase [Bacteroidetes bacterium]|nr:M20/M25/M40 family metallo-hydrolase [Bacteroidota bacterium]
MKKLLLLALLQGSFLLTLSAQEPVNDSIIAVIKKHGMDKSKVMETASMITDMYGPRLTGSPMLDKATNWAVQQLKDWGYQNVHLDEWGPFGRGWELKHFEMSCEGPSYWPIIAYPKAWSPSTKGLVKGEVVYLNASTVEDLEKYKGKLKGKFVLIDTLRALKEWEEPLAKRLTPEELLEMANAAKPQAGGRRGNRNFPESGREFVKKMREMLYAEKPLATIDRSFKGDLGTVFVSGASAKDGSARDEGAEVLPQVTMSVEHYNRIFRLLAMGIPVTLSMEIQAEYTNKDGMEHNIVAEIPGTDLKDEVVMFGAHFDSWHTGTGATDNGAGSAVMLETARILLETIKETGIQPRRTLRIALWTGEEQGLLGSRSYVTNQVGLIDADGNLNKKGDYDKISAYYNLDNGTGKIRGVYLQGNDDASSIFRAWLDPFKDMGATTLTLQNTGGTDHLSFHAVGVPGFQFIQDGMSYWSRTHHSNMDNYDHFVEADLKQAATIVASFVWHTSQRDEKMPRRKMEERTAAQGN